MWLLIFSTAAWPYVHHQPGTFRTVCSSDTVVFAGGIDESNHELLVALDQNGDTLWIRTNTPSNQESSFMGAEIEGNTLFLGGWDGPFGQGSFLYAKYSVDGTLLLRDTFDLSLATDDYLMEIGLGNGMLIGVGTSYNPNNYTSDGIVEARDTQDLHLLWRDTLDLEDSDAFTDADLDPAGRVWVCGHSRKPSSVYYQGVVRLYSSTGQLRWQQTIDLSYYTTKLYALDAAGDRCVVAGYTSPDGSDYDALILVMDTLGNILSQNVYSVGTNADDRLYGVAWLSDTGVVAGGVSGTENGFALKSLFDTNPEWVKWLSPDTSARGDDLCLGPGDTVFIAGDQDMNYPAVYKVDPSTSRVLEPGTGTCLNPEKPQLLSRRHALVLRMGRGASAEEVQVFNAFGSLIRTWHGISRELIVNLKPGVYLVLIREQGLEFSLKGVVLP